MIKIKCAKCQRRIFRYRKVGKGRILQCWKDKITRDYSVRIGTEVRCPCGCLIGVDQGESVKMKQGAFIRSGSTSKE